MSAPSDERTIAHPITLGSPEFMADQHFYYDWMRRQAPVYRGRMTLLGDQDVYYVSRYRDCLDVVTDPRIQRVVPGAEPLPLPAALRMLTDHAMIYKDDPEHMRLRKLVSRPFTPKAIGRLADRVDTVTRELLDGMESGQRIDLQQDYALPVPTTVINEMVGVPETDRYRFRGFIEVMVDGIATYGLEMAALKMEGFIDYLRELIELRRADPGEDILTGLIHTCEDGDTPE